MLKILSLFSFTLFFLVTIISCNSFVEVELKQGVVSGKVETSFFKGLNYYAFKGIPYAQPPLKTLRFLAPEPHSGWQGTYAAHKNKPTCLQFNSRLRMGESFGISGSEDCLYISVFTPNLKEKLAVVVFDYNDNFRTGFNETDTYSPDFFVEEEVIVVTINHRLGVFGYLTTDDDVIPANVGVKDFILGLKWVQDNIIQFGGDPNRVTLMGNRGGAALANIMLYTDKAKGLFSGVTLQSGTAFEPIYFFDNPSTKAFELGKIIGVETNDSAILLEGLQATDAEILISKAIEVVDVDVLEKYQMNVYPFAPTVERFSSGKLISNLPEKAVVQNDVPVLIGLNSRDGLDVVSFLLAEPRMLAEFGKDSGFHFPIRAGFRFDKNNPIFNYALNEIGEYYYKHGNLRVNVDDLMNYAMYVGDTLQNYAIDFAANNLAKELSSKVFYYMFDFRGILNENSEYIMKQAKFSPEHWGATMGDELCYLHLCTRIKTNYEKLMHMVSKQHEIKVLKKMVRMWTNFIKFGDPTPVADNMLKIRWEPVELDTMSNAKYLHIDKKFKMKINPLGKRKLFWDEFLEKYSKFAIDGVVGDKAIDYVKTDGRKFAEKEDDDMDYNEENDEEYEDCSKNNDGSEVKEVDKDHSYEKVVIVENSINNNIEEHNEL